MRRIFLALICAASAAFSFAQTPQVRMTGGPYLQNVTETSFTVVWTTNMDAISWVEIAPDDGTSFYNVERPKYYDKRGLGRRPITNLHKVTVTGPRRVPWSCCVCYSCVTGLSHSRGWNREL